MADGHPVPDRTIRIGRQPDNDIALTGDLDVSRHHAELRRNPDGSFEIIDLGSHGGTYVNGKRITSKVLAEQDVISIGRAMFRLSHGELRQYADEGAMTIADRLAFLGIELPPPFPPAGNYLARLIDEGLVYVGGHGPIVGDQMIRGKVGVDLTLEQGREAARITALSILATLQAELGDLGRIQRIIKVFGMVNVAPGFDLTPAVIDACSDLLIEIFGDAGRHTRSAVGLAELPFGIPVEIELVARLRT
jgi:enamine deaminase RidA (YjgF/YER057c/UK114 family)